MSTLRVNNLQNTSTTDGGISINASGHVTVDGVAYPSAGPLSNRNRIINGDMRIDQRNAGASVTPSGGDAQYTLDRWRARYTQANKYSVQQVNDAPTGFNTSLRVTSLSAYSVAASDYFAVEQIIEGYNFADLAFGSAAASLVTLSFWVKSSLTGTFGGSLAGAGYTRSYPFTYTISAANTWERKTISLSGDTGGTYNTTNAAAMEVFFGFGVGSNLSGTAGSWLSSGSVSATGATSVVGTNGATFYITGVQLEVGSVATPFEHRSYSDELARCQRYFFSSFPQGTAPGKGVANTVDLELPATSGSFSPNRYFGLQHKQNMRGPAAITFYNSQNASAGDNTIKGYYWVDGGATGSGDYAVNLDVAGHNAFGGYFVTSGFGNAIMRFHYTASAEL